MAIRESLGISVTMMPPGGGYVWHAASYPVKGIDEGYASRPLCQTLFLFPNSRIAANANGGTPLLIQLKPRHASHTPKRVHHHHRPRASLYSYGSPNVKP